MPAVSSSLEKIPQNPPISPALRPETIRHPDKRSKLENDATCGLARTLSGRVRRPEGLQNSINFGSYFQPYAYRAVTPARASSRNFNPANATFVELHCCDLPHRYWSSRVV